VLNKTFDTLPVDIRVEKPAGAEIRLIGDFTTLHPQAIQEGRFLLIVPKTELQPTATEVEFVVMSGDREIERIKSSFIGPQTLD
jgi:hypothetical protein